MTTAGTPSASSPPSAVPSPGSCADYAAREFATSMTQSADVLDAFESACRQRLTSWTHTFKMNKRFLLLICPLAIALRVSAAYGQLIIANPSVKVVNVAKSDIKDVFLGDSSTLGGVHVTPILLKSGSAKDRFLSAYIGKSEAAFMASWRTLVLSGQATMPRTVNSEAAVVEFVAKTPGAVGYVSKDTPHEGVRVLADR